MKGLIRQRGTSWELRVYLGRDPLTGKKRYVSRTVAAAGATPSLRSPKWSPRPNAA